MDIIIYNISGVRGMDNGSVDPAQLAYVSNTGMKHEAGPSMSFRI